MSGSKKRMKPMKFKSVDEAVLLRLQEMRAKNIAVSDPAMLIKAEEFAKHYGGISFKASQGCCKNSNSGMVLFARLFQVSKT